MNTQTAVGASSTDLIEQSTFSWKAVFAGAFVSVLVYMILLSLGMAFGGANLEGVISEGDSAKGLGIGAAIWMIVSTLLSIFSGSYAAGRVSGLISARVGRIQGLVVSALFFALIFSQVGSAIGLMSRGLGSTVGALGGAAGNVAGNSKVQQVMDDAIGDLNLKSSPETVATGVATRLMRGDDQSAMTYLSRQTGISQTEARTRLNGVKTQITQAAGDVGSAAADTLRVAGWTIFGALFLGSIIAMLGGGVGALGNLRSPLTSSDRNAMRHSGSGRPATV